MAKRKKKSKQVREWLGDEAIFIYGHAGDDYCTVTLCDGYDVCSIYVDAGQLEQLIGALQKLQELANE